MSAYRKINNLLLTMTVEQIIEKLKAQYKELSLVPIAMRQKFDPRITQDSRFKNQFMTAKEILKNKEKLSYQIEKAYNDLDWDHRFIQWYRPTPDKLSLDDTIDGHLEKNEEAYQRWWQKHVDEKTELRAVLLDHHETFAWPNRLPTIRKLTDMLVAPKTLAADPIEASRVVREILNKIRADKKEAREQQKQEQAKRVEANQNALKLKRQQQEAIEKHLLEKGQLPDTDRRSWRRLAEVAELVQLSASTVRADLKKGRLEVTAYTAGGYMRNATSVHDRPSIRDYISKWRTNINLDCVDDSTIEEMKAADRLNHQKNWQHFLDTKPVPNFQKLETPASFPSFLTLYVAETDEAAFFKFSKSSCLGLDELNEEINELIKLWNEILRERLESWSVLEQQAFLDFLQKNPLQHKMEVSWPNATTISEISGKLNPILKDQVSEFVKKSPQVAKAICGMTLTHPLSWYPKARTTKRRWVLHFGPTNSGKTHDAMKAMMSAPTGLYLAPLRLMALENYDLLVAAGKHAQLLTGEERRTFKPENILDVSPDPTHVSATIEAGFDEGRLYDIAVIDEAQMISDHQRGWAWSQALVGVLAREIHVCASPAAKDMLLGLINQMGEPFSIIEHNRLTPLEEIPHHIKLKDLDKGDALVVFSRRELLSYRHWLMERGKTVAVIYGDLGPEVRQAEAERFRSGKAEILVATDAIGMGLNLPIRRVIFSDTTKYDGEKVRPLTHAEWSQIAGRAGRHGLYEKGFYGVLANAKPLNKKNSLPASGIRYRPHTPLVKRLGAWLEWENVGQVAKFFEKPGHGILPSARWGSPELLDFIAGTKHALEDQYRYLNAPISKQTMSMMKQWMTGHAEGKKIQLHNLDFKSQGTSSETLQNMEYHASLIRLYRWGHQMFPDAYIDDVTDQHGEISKLIADYLSQRPIAVLCSSCGHKLPVGHKHVSCNACYHKKQNEWGYYD